MSEKGRRGERKKRGRETGYVGIDKKKKWFWIVVLPSPMCMILLPIPIALGRTNTHKRSIIVIIFLIDWNPNMINFAGEGLLGDEVKKTREENDESHAPLMDISK